MPYDSRAVANYFLILAANEGKTLTPMQIQKLVYFAHGWHLAIYGTPLIGEDIEAWSYGPVISSLYHEFKKFGDAPIQGFANLSEFPRRRFRLGSSPDVASNKLDPETKEFLDRVWRVYSPFTAIQLSNMTHEDGSPWKLALDESANARHTVIPNDLIREYFSKKASQHAAGRATT